MTIDLRIATKAYAQRNGSHRGMRPSKLLRVKVSTPVLINMDSEIIIAQNPNAIKIKSPFPLFRDIQKMMIRKYAKVSM